MAHPRRLLRWVGEALDDAWGRLITRGRTSRPINMFWDGSSEQAPDAVPGLTFAQAAHAMAQAQKQLHDAQVKVRVPRAPAVIPPNNIDDLTSAVQLTKGERVADHVTDFIGSWPFIIGLATFLFTWFCVNTIPALFHWDPWPWMGANIIMSTMAAFATSLVIIAQKVGSRRDRAFWNMMIQMLTHNEQTADRVELVLRHVEKIGAADHVEHGNILRDLQSHTTCLGHTTIGESVPGGIEQALADVKDMLRLVLAAQDVPPDHVETWLAMGKADTQPSTPVVAAPAAVETAAEPDAAERMRQASRPGTRVVTADGSDAERSPAKAPAKPRRAAKKGVQQ